MTVEEIFSRMKAHALEGMVFHDEMARYFDFLNLCGYRECHKCHYEDETEGYYVLYNFESTPEFPVEIERRLNINENVLRSLVTVAVAK